MNIENPAIREQELRDELHALQFETWVCDACSKHHDREESLHLFEEPDGLGGTESYHIHKCECGHEEMSY